MAINWKQYPVSKVLGTSDTIIVSRPDGSTFNINSSISTSTTGVTITGTLAVSGAFTVGGITLAETIADTVGAMVTSNTESGITVAYVDGDNTLDFTVGTLNQNTTGNAATVTTNANLTGHVTSSGNAAVLGSFSSAQLKAALTDETGSGVAVFATSPALVTPALGTPASGVMTNATGTASNLTAGNVTTNANLTGHVTSSGNAAVLGSFTVAQLNTALSNGSINTDQTTVSGSSGSCTGNAATATKLAATKTIGGVAFDGSANIDLPGVSATGDQDTSGNALTATTATNATNAAHVLVTDNESTAEANLITFVENATDSTGNVGLEMDGNFTYTPSTGKVNAVNFQGNIIGGSGSFSSELTIEGGISDEDDVVVLTTKSEGVNIPGLLTASKQTDSTPTLSAKTSDFTAAAGNEYVINKASGIAIALPAAVEGVTIKFVFQTAITSNTAVITALSGDLLTGYSLVRDISNLDTFQSGLSFFIADGTDDLIMTLNGSTKGGLVGDRIEFVGISATQWRVRAMLTGSGSLVTSFS